MEIDPFDLILFRNAEKLKEKKDIGKYKLFKYIMRKIKSKDNKKNVISRRRG